MNPINILIEIAIPTAGPSDDHASYLYYYDGIRLNFMGYLPRTTDKGYSVIPYVNGSGEILSSARGRVLHTWFYKARYRLDENHNLVQVKELLYDMNWPVTMKTELPLQKSPSESEIVTVLQPGEEVTLVGSDDEFWCLAESADGTRGWFAIKGFGTIIGTGKWAGDVFDGLNMAD